MKICTKCGSSKELSEFNFKIKSKNTYSPHCRDCSKQYVRGHYLENRNYYLAKAKLRNSAVRLEIKSYIRDYLKKHECIDCGESDPIVLEFDHVNSDKLFNISEMAREKFAIKKVEEEIKKCEVRCANCHRRKTALQFGWFSSKKAPVA